MDPARTKVELHGVSETLLWTLYYRAAEARRPDAVIDDPRAVELLDAIDYPFAERFGAANPVMAQGQALRVRRFDEEVGRFLAAYPDGTVIALGEGLETQFWRVDNGRAHWVTVDLPEVLDVRRRLLPTPPRGRAVAGSALDERWMNEIDTTRGVLVTAQGLLMYLQPAEVHRLVETCAQRLPGGGLIFDAVPGWFGAATRRGVMRMPSGYQAPPMPWAMTAGERAWLRAVPNVVSVRELWLPTGRGVFYGHLAPLCALLPPLRHLLPSITLARFGIGGGRP